MVALCAGMAVSLLDPQAGDSIIDCCAAPGGKASYAAMKMQGKGKILAIDINARRIKMVADAARRQGVCMYVLVCMYWYMRARCSQ